MMETYLRGQKLVCPHCGKRADDNVEDFVVEGSMGQLNYWYDEMCGWCDGTFSVRKTRSGTFQVKSTSGDEEALE